MPDDAAVAAAAESDEIGRLCAEIFQGVTRLSRCAQGDNKKKKRQVDMSK